MSIFPPSLQVFRLTAGTFLNYGKIWTILQSTYLDPGFFCFAKKERVRSKVFLSCYRTSLGLGFRIRRTYKYAFIAKNLHLLRGRASTAQQGRGWLKRSWIPVHALNCCPVFLVPLIPFPIFRGSFLWWPPVSFRWWGSFRW